MFTPSPSYTLIRKGEIILAVPSGGYIFASNELEALYSQGFIYCAEIWAPTPTRAVEIFTENEKLEINKLRQEISELQKTCDEMRRENDSLRWNASSYNDPSNSIKPLEIFGFSDTPDPYELKKRYRSLCQLTHPDTGGDTKLFQLIQQAYNALAKP
jgi:hypothetical protein